VVTIAGGHDPAALHELYRDAKPFPHAVIDGFLDPESAERTATELEAADIALWHCDDHQEQVNKLWMDRPEQLPQTAGEALRYMNSPEVCGFFSVLTGIPDLQADDAYLGGGVHVSTAGGRLGVHADFNLHPSTGMHRRVNALLFLNRDWDPAWHGQLELWSKDLTHPVVSLDPIFNRLVVFTITDDAFHGVPAPIACPPNRRRLSLALYYYTADRPDEEKAPFHWASWKLVGRR
jgi:Rps23 Pro-64 3,4-dihydroxylase Tpa1-like proline 4-hydroxylase